MASKVSSLIARANMARPEPARDPMGDVYALILQSQNVLADILTRNFTPEIAAQAKAIVATEMQALEQRVCENLKPLSEAEIRTIVKAVAKAVVDDAISQIEMPEPMEREDDEDEEPKTVTVQRKDGIISIVKVGETSYDVIRNKSGLIKEVRPR